MWRLICERLKSRLNFSHSNFDMHLTFVGFSIQKLWAFWKKYFFGNRYCNSKLVILIQDSGHLVRYYFFKRLMDGWSPGGVKYRAAYAANDNEHQPEQLFPTPCFPLSVKEENKHRAGENRGQAENGNTFFLPSSSELSQHHPQQCYVASMVVTHRCDLRQVREPGHPASPNQLHCAGWSPAGTDQIWSLWFKRAAIVSNNTSMNLNQVCLCILQVVFF